MPASSQNRPTSGNPRQRLPLTPAVTTLRRGGHRSTAPAATAVTESIPSHPGARLSLISSARGVRLSRER